MEQYRISSLTPGGAAHPIEIKVLRQWIPFRNQKDKCFLFIDKHGDAIEALINIQEASDLLASINLLSCYRISNYICDTARTAMKTCAHPASLRLGKSATFTPIPYTDFPANYFRFLAYDKLHTRLNKHEYLTDFIGRIVSINESVTRNNSNLLKIKLEALSGQQIEAALWQEIADSFDKQAATSLNELVIIVLTSTKISEYMDNLQLGSSPATHTYLNPNVPETNDLIARFHTLQKPTDPPTGTLQIQASERPSTTDMQTLSNLLHMLPTTAVGNHFNCIASITEIHQHRNWYYKSCTFCKRKAKPRAPTYACEEHGQIDEPRLLFCFTATITDDTGSTTATFFDEGGKSLLQTTCAEMVITQGYTDPLIVPQPFLAFLGKNFTLQLEVANRTYANSSPFTVKNVIRIADPQLTVPPALPLTPTTKPTEHAITTPNPREQVATRGRKRLFHSQVSDENSSKKHKDAAN